MNIIYKEIDEKIEVSIIKEFGRWVSDCNCLIRGKGCYLIAALSNDKVVGFAALHPEQWIAPLEKYFDAFIEVIEVNEKYQKQGIGSKLVEKLEKFAKSYGYYQIRAWSSIECVSALKMFYKLQYCMCPAAMLGTSVLHGYENKQIVGYYYAKLL